MIKVRAYKNSDYSTISSWWKNSTGARPAKGLMIENGTFILELNGIPAMCLTVLLTQSKEIAYCTAFIKNPIFKDDNLEEYGQILWSCCNAYAKSNGYKRTICFSNIPQLQEKYKRFGYIPEHKNLTNFVKEL